MSLSSESMIALQRGHTYGKRPPDGDHLWSDSLAAFYGDGRSSHTSETAYQWVFDEPSRQSVESGLLNTQKISDSTAYRKSQLASHDSCGEKHDSIRYDAQLAQYGIFTSQDLPVERNATQQPARAEHPKNSHGRASRIEYIDLTVTSDTECHADRPKPVKNNQAQEGSNPGSLSRIKTARDSVKRPNNSTIKRTAKPASIFCDAGYESGDSNGTSSLWADGAPAGERVPGPKSIEGRQFQTGAEERSASEATIPPMTNPSGGGTGSKKRLPFHDDTSSEEQRAKRPRKGHKAGYLRGLKVLSPRPLSAKKHGKTNPKYLHVDDYGSKKNQDAVAATSTTSASHSQDSYSTALSRETPAVAPESQTEMSYLSVEGQKQCGMAKIESIAAQLVKELNDFPGTITTAERSLDEVLKVLKAKQAPVQQESDPESGKAFPSTGGKTWNEDAFREYLAMRHTESPVRNENALPAAAQDPQIVTGEEEVAAGAQYEDREESPITEEDLRYYEYHVKLRFWLADTEEENAEWTVLQPFSFTSLTEANNASFQYMHGIMADLSRKSGIQEYRYMDEDFMARHWCSTRNGYYRINVDRSLCLQAHRIQPVSKKDWLHKKVYEIRRRSITKLQKSGTDDAPSHGAMESVGPVEVIDGLYTILDEANREAGKLVLAVSTDSESKRLDDVLFRLEAHKKMDEVIDDLERNKEMFSLTVGLSDNTELDIWVEERELKGPRNI